MNRHVVYRKNAVALDHRYVASPRNAQTISLIHDVVSPTVNHVAFRPDESPFYKEHAKTEQVRLDFSE